MTCQAVGDECHCIPLIQLVKATPKIMCLSLTDGGKYRDKGESRADYCSHETILTELAVFLLSQFGYLACEVILV